jgi:neutral trehalase
MILEGPSLGVEVFVTKKGFPLVHFYDQDFVDIYDRTWAWIQDFWRKGTEKNRFQSRYFNYPDSKNISQFEACLSTFFLVYSNRIYPVSPLLDNFYGRQADDGAICGEYREADGRAVRSKKNPKGVQPPLFSWAEFNLYHKIGNKKRLRDVVPVLEKYFSWLESTFKDETGLYVVPLFATRMDNAPREDAHYLVDFNAQQAINALYMSAIGDILNDKELSFRYKRQYFSLKTRINSQMWDEKQGIYCDLDEKGKVLPTKTIAAFWTLLGEIPNEDKANRLIDHLKNPKTFGTENPFPTVAADEAAFDEEGRGCSGSVYPPFTFMVIKGLEKYGRYDLARECSIRHLYFMLDTLHPEGKEKGNLYEAYQPNKDGPAKWPEKRGWPRALYLPYAALSSITLVIENVIGLYISLPRKTVDWIVPTMEIMGIEDLSLKRNMITILSNKSGRGWEIRLESEKLYYFTINILDEGKKRTLPIPSGKCSMLIDKL